MGINITVATSTHQDVLLLWMEIHMFSLYTKAVGHMVGQYIWGDARFMCAARPFSTGPCTPVRYTLAFKCIL